MCALKGDHEVHNDDSQVAFGVLTVSDTCSQDATLDRSGPVAIELIQDRGHCVVRSSCVPDESELIHSVLIQWIDSGLMDVIISTGGTGLSPRDVTPEAVLRIIQPDKRLQGLEHALYSTSLQYTSRAALSRLVVGVCNRVIVVALPGSPKAISECLPVVLANVEHAVGLLKGNRVPREANASVCHAPVRSVVDRPRKSPFPMISVEDAQSMIFSLSRLVTWDRELEAVPFKNSLSRILGLTLKSSLPVPPFRTSRMDGYAVKYFNQPCTLRVIGSLVAGDSVANVVDVDENTCVRISTGGPVPLGTEAIVPVENTRIVSKRPLLEDKEEENYIEVLVPPMKPGEYIRPVGSDLPANYTFKRGLILGPTEISLLSMAGLLAPHQNYLDELSVDSTHFVLSESTVKLLSLGGYLPCIKQPIIGLLSTGNELIGCSQPLAPEGIVDCNLPLLLLLLRKYGYSQVLDLGIVKDDEVSLNNAFHKAFKLCDLVITTGGASMGERDLVPIILTDKFNANIHFSRVFVKPGKPAKVASVTYCSTKGVEKTVILFCLPGNPVSVFVLVHLFVLPFLRKLEQRPSEEWNFPRIKVRLAHFVPLSDRPEYLRARLKWNVQPVADETSALPFAVFDHLGSQDSSRLASCLDANLLLILPAATSSCSELTVGSIVEALFLDN